MGKYNMFIVSKLIKIAVCQAKPILNVYLLLT